MIFSFFQPHSELIFSKELLIWLNIAEKMKISSNFAPLYKSFKWLYNVFLADLNALGTYLWIRKNRIWFGIDFWKIFKKKFWPPSEPIFSKELLIGLNRAEQRRISSNFAPLYKSFKWLYNAFLADLNALGTYLWIRKNRIRFGIDFSKIFKKKFWPPSEPIFSKELLIGYT